MAALEAAQQQLEAALARLEAAVARGSGRGEAATAAAARERDALGEECRRLRAELDAAGEANARLATAALEAERRLDEAIARLDAAAGGGGG